MSAKPLGTKMDYNGVMRSRPITFILLALISGCSSPQKQAIPFEESYPGTGVHTLQVAMDRGRIELDAAPGDEILIEGSALSAVGPAISQDAGVLLIDFESSAAADVLEISLPDNLSLELRCYDVNLALSQYRGAVQIRNTAGDILAEGIAGDISLRAGRGDITLAGGEGTAVISGEHGRLSVSGFSGPVSMTTIMGSIDFAGSQNSPGDVRLESDHGPILAAIPENSNYLISISSASGEVICQGGNLSPTITGCTGSTGDGSRTLNIRTVSGRIDFRILPGQNSQDGD